MSTPEEVREALRRVESALTGFGGGDACHYGATGGCGDKSCGGCQSALGLLDTLESALTPPPVEDTAVEKALRLLGRYPPECSCDGVGHDYCPVRDFVDAEDTLRAALAAKDAEIERLLWPLGKNICPMCRKKVRGADDLHTCYDAYDAVCSQLAAAEARGDADDAEAFRKGHAAGFRAAADFVAYCRNTDEDGDYGDLRPIIHTLRAEADRREGSDE